MLPAKFFLCSIVGSDGESLCGNISQFVGPTLAPKGHVIELTTYFGALPCLGCGGTAAKSVWCNGGIPQLANLTWHKQQMTRQLPAKVSADFDGIIDVDYESWYPVFEAAGESYRNASRALARTQLPAGASAAQIEAKAEADYNAASRTFLIATLQHVKSLVPNASVGFYGLPRPPYWHYNQTREHALNVALAPVYAEQDVLLPDVYLPYRTGPGGEATFEAERAYVDHKLENAADVNVILAARGVKPKMVAPYAWYRYHDGEPSGLMPLNANDTLLEFGAPELTHSVDHVIIWGWENGNQTATDEARSWFEAHADVFRGEARAAPAPALHRTATQAPRAAARVASAPPIDPMVPPPPYTKCSL